jgi:tRNA pseudouridine38-40 synthase
MVRAISGTLLSIGRGELNSDAVQKAIAAGVRPTVAATAPACGLTLLSVRYSENTD